MTPAAGRAPALSLALASVLLSLAGLLPVGSASAQYVAFPRLGLSAAPDRHEPRLAVHGREPFTLHVIVLPRPDQAVLEHDYSSFHWAVLEACCGGAGEILDLQDGPSCLSEGEPLGGVVSQLEECAGGQVVHLAALTMRMTVDEPGEYWFLAGPLAQATTCDQQPVVMTDLMVHVDYTSDVMPVAPSSLSGVKSLFRGR